MKKILLSMSIMLIILVIPNIVNAATSTVTLQEVKVISPASGTYKTGEVITLEAIFSDDIFGEESDVPKLKLKFGTSQLYGESYTEAGKIDKNKIVYTYTIQNSDGGKMSLKSIGVGFLKDKDGNNINIVQPDSLSGNSISANPMVWTDVSNVKISVDSEYNLNINGLTQLERHMYYVFITPNDTKPTLEFDKSSRVSNADMNFREKSYIAEFIEKKDDMFYWLCEEQRNYETGEFEQKFLISAKKLERPVLKNLSARMKCYFFDDNTSIHLFEAHSSTDRKIKLKIGNITDNSILLAIKNGEKNALARLLDYAKKADSIYTGVLPLGRSDSITSKMNLQNKAYYYVYMQLEDEKGIYYPIEDVSLYQAHVSETIGKNLWDYLDGQFSWNISEKNYFSDFSESNFTIDNPNKSQYSIALKNIKVNTEKKHQFYYYISNSRDDVPSYESNLWKKAKNVVIDEKNGTCYIETGNILDLSYASKINLSVDKYIYIYEVIDDKEITAENIEGNYKLVLNAKKIAVDVPENKPEQKPDTNVNDNVKPNEDKTVATSPIPQTGDLVYVVVIGVMLVSAIGIIMYKKFKYLNF